MEFIFTRNCPGSYGYRIALPKITIFGTIFEKRISEFSVWKSYDKEFEFDGEVWVSWEFNNKIDLMVVLEMLNERNATLKNWKEIINND